MISYKSTSNFRERLQSLVTYKRDVYAGALVEVKTAFKGASIEQVRSNRDMILMQSDALVVKLRLPDKRQRLSRANGYRLIYLVSLVEERVALLDIYPKREPLQQLDIPEDELLRLLAQYVDEGNRDALKDFEL